MLTTREKKIGIILLIISAVGVIALILMKTVFAENKTPIHGNGVAREDGRLSVVPVAVSTPAFYDNALEYGGKDSALAQAVTYGVYAEVVRDAEGSAAIAEAEQRQDELLQQHADGATEPDFTSLGSDMTSNYYANAVISLQGNTLPSDTVSLTSKFVAFDSVVNVYELALANIFYDRTNLPKTRVLGEGSLLREGNSIEKLYNEGIVPYYAEGTYCALKLTADSVECLAGNDLLCLLMDGMSPSEVQSYLDAGETLNTLVDKGVLSLDYEVGEGVATYDNAYAMCGIIYDAAYVDTLGATEELAVVHIVGSKVIVEHYAVGNAYYEDSMPVEAGVDADGNPVFDSEPIRVAVFTGYYCW